MTTITLNRKQIEKEIGKLDEKMQEKIVMAGLEIDSINDYEFVLDVTPNRPDLLSNAGFIRFMKNYLGKSKPQEYKTKKPQKDYVINIDNSVKNVRPFTVCAIVKNLKFNDETIKRLLTYKKNFTRQLEEKEKS
jgi:phenylalanyl-tRNA synthetase beta chain